MRTEPLDSFSIGELATATAGAWKLLAGTFLACALAMAIYYAVTPTLYETNAVLVAAFNPTATPPVAASSSFVRDRFQAQYEVWAAILQSHQLAERVMGRLQLQSSTQMRREELEQQTLDNSTVVIGDNGLLTIRVQNDSAQRAAAIANTEIAVLMERLTSLRQESFENEATALHVQLLREGSVVREAEQEKLQQENHSGLVNVASQTTMLLALDSALLQQIRALQTREKGLEEYAGPNHPEVQRHENEIAELLAIRHQYESSSKRADTSASAVPSIPAFDQIPPEEMEQRHANSKLKLSEQRLTVIAHELERLRIEVNSPSPVHVLEPAVANDEPDSRSRVISILVAGLTGMGLAFAFVVSKLLFRRVKSGSAPEVKQSPGKSSSSPLAGLRQACCCAIVLCLPFSDSIFAASPLGTVAGSLSLFPLLACLFLDALEATTQGLAFRARASWLLLALWAATLSGIYILLWGTAVNDTNVLTKATTSFINTAVFVYACVGVRSKPSRAFKLCLYTAFALLFLGVFLCDFNALGLGTLLSPVVHNRPNSDGRWRSFSPEPSCLSVLLVCLGFASAYVSQRRVTQFALLTATLVGMLGCASKGGLLGLLVVIACAVTLFRPGFKSLAVAVSIVVAGYVAGLPFIASQLSDSLLAESNSFVTRGALAIWSGQVLLHHPLGVGFSGFFGAFPRYLPASINTFYKLVSIPMNYAEIETYVYGTKNLSSKTMLGDFTVIFGWPFLLAALGMTILFVMRLVRRQQLLLLIAFLYVVMAASTYISMTAHFEIALVIQLCRHAFKNHESTASRA